MASSTVLDKLVSLFCADVVFFIHTKYESLCFYLQPFHPMVNLQCSPELRMFLCALYAPVCTEYGRMTLPCRRLCLQAKSDCYKLMDMFGVSWPQEMDCNRLAQQQ